MRLEEFQIETENGERIDKYLSNEMSGFSRSYIQKLMKDGHVYVNGKAVKANYKLAYDDMITVEIPDLVEPDIVPENIPLEILYEDDDILIVNKPKGMVVHPAAGHYSGTLVNALMYHCGESLSGINGVMRPGIVHRIDMDTTGSLLVCKNDQAHQKLAEQLKVHSIKRVYHAIVCGNLKEDSGTIDAPIGRHPVDRKKMSINISCRLETGRTHQIRVHMASIRHPLLGDTVYGPQKCPFKLQGQTLHAKILGITHPTTGEYMEFDAPLPEYFEDLLGRMRQNR